MQTLTAILVMVAIELFLASLVGWGILSLVDVIASTDVGTWLNGLYLAVGIKLVRIFF